MTSIDVRSALFVPATRPDRITKAINSGADRVIADLEDAVEEVLKEQARDNLAIFLDQHPDAQVLVRINAPDHWAHGADLDLCRRHQNVIGVLLPKAETAEQVEVVAATGKPVWPIIESAKGLAAVNSIAAAAAVERLSFGSLDLALDMRLTNGSQAAERILDHARFAVLLATQVAGLAPALDGVYPSIQDTGGLQNAVRDARNMGFGGALCIHPSQVSIIHSAFASSPEELQWARRIVEAASSGKGVFVMDGEMVDAPVISRAQAILARIV